MKILLVTATAIVVIAATGAHKQPVPIANQDPQASHEKVSCHSVDGLPDPSCTPGAVRPGADTVDAICNSGSTRQWRPNTSVTNALKKQGIIDYGYSDTNMADYEEDHLISLEIGGDGSDPKNLWPEPHTGKYNSFVKDKVENWLHKQVCSGAMTPKDAQQGIATDWRQYIPNVVQTSTKEVE
jgi:hypothetical protein